MKWNMIIIKSFTWRLIATLTTVIIAFIVTGEIIFALEIGAAEFFIKIIIFYVHEIIWEKFKI